MHQCVAESNNIRNALYHNSVFLRDARSFIHVAPLIRLNAINADTRRILLSFARILTKLATNADLKDISLPNVTRFKARDGEKKPDRQDNHELLEVKKAKLEEEQMEHPGETNKVGDSDES